MLGLDLSESMLARAAAMTADPGITDRRADLETAALPEAGFDLAFSSLTLHDIADLAGLLARLHRALRPGPLRRPDGASDLHRPVAPGLA